MRGACLLALVSLAAAQEPPRLRLDLAIEGGRLTANIERCPLLQVLDELTSKTQIAITAADGLGEDLVSIQLKKVPLDEALRVLLKGYDAFYYYGVEKDGPAALRAVWIYPKGRARGLRPVPPEAWASTKDLEAALADSDPAVREKAYEGLIARPDPRSRDLVLQALRGRRESDDDLRQRIFQSALTQGMELPQEVLVELVSSDRSEQMRWMALDTLSFRGNAKTAAEAALNDPSETVRARAREILAALEAAAQRSKRPAPESQPLPQ
jgi:hypothetical protein